MVHFCTLYTPMMPIIKLSNYLLKQTSIPKITFLHTIPYVLVVQLSLNDQPQMVEDHGKLQLSP